MLTGGCLCGSLRFEATGEVHMRGLCFCRTCQKVSGGGGNFFIGVVAAEFRYVKGEPCLFSLSPESPTREFCGICGVQIAARSPRAPNGVIIKVGTLDSPRIFDGPDIVVWVEEKEPFHHVPEGAAAYSRLPLPHGDRGHERSPSGAG